MKLSESMLRLYAVTDRSWTGKQTLHQQVESALRGGATCVQLREKDAEPALFLEEAIGLRALCGHYGVPLIINDNVALAQEIGADGVHVGQDDMDPRQVRALLGPGKIIGVTAKTVEQAVRAQQAGADYLGSGAVFGSTTKLNTRPMSQETLRQICQAVTIPVVAIGGINRQNILELQHTGIRGVAVVSGIFAAEDIEGECRYLRSLAEML